jgi:hypothetical protein
MCGKQCRRNETVFNETVHRMKIDQLPIQPHVFGNGRSGAANGQRLLRNQAVRGTRGYLRTYISFSTDWRWLPTKELAGEVAESFSVTRMLATLHADKLGPLRLPMFIKPIRKNESRQMVRRTSHNRLNETGILRHGHGRLHTSGIVLGSSPS